MTPLAPGSRRTVAALTWVCSLALLAPLMRPLFTGRVFVYNDLSWFHLPLRYLYHQALRAGDSVLWTPSIFAGFYVHGEGQAGLFHPLHQLLYRFLPLGTAFNLELIANYPAVFAGTYWLLRRLAISHAGSLFGAMLFAFSGFNLLHHVHLNMVAVVAHMPWLLATADVLIVDRSNRVRLLAFAGIAVIFASELLLGFPQAVWWNVIALAAFGVLRIADTRHWRQLLPCAGALVLGILLGGIQLLPTADFAAHSTRTGLSRAFALTYSLHPSNLLQICSPYFFARGAHSLGDYMWFHDFGIYSGAILPVALLWVWHRREVLRSQRTLITGLTVFAAVTLVLALGRYGGLAALLTHLPLLGSLRAPVRYIVLVQFALAILAAIALDDLLAIADGHSAPSRGLTAPLWIPAAVGIVTLLALNTGLLPYGRHTFASAAVAAPGVAIVIAVTLLVYLAGRRVRWALAALIVVTTVDLAAWGIRFTYNEPARTIQELTDGVLPAPVEAGDTYASAPRRGRYIHNLLVMRGYRLTSGYAGLFPATRHPLDSDSALRLSGTRWHFTTDGSRHPVEGTVGRVRLLDEQERSSIGAVRLTVDRPGRLVTEVEAPGRRILAFTERFHRGWLATVDGVPVPVVRVEGDFLGCLLEGGVHQVDLRFMPGSFLYGSIVSVAGALLLAGVVVTRWR